MISFSLILFFLSFFLVEEKRYKGRKNKWKLLHFLGRQSRTLFLASNPRVKEKMIILWMESCFRNETRIISVPANAQLVTRSSSLVVHRHKNSWQGWSMKFVYKRIKERHQRDTRSTVSSPERSHFPPNIYHNQLVSLPFNRIIKT